MQDQFDPHWPPSTSDTSTVHTSKNHTTTIQTNAGQVSTRNDYTSTEHTSTCRSNTAQTQHKSTESQPHGCQTGVETVDITVPHIMEDTVEVVKIIPWGRVQYRVHAKLVFMSVQSEWSPSYISKSTCKLSPTDCGPLKFLLDFHDTTASEILAHSS